MSPTNTAALLSTIGNTVTLIANSGTWAGQVVRYHDGVAAIRHESGNVFDVVFALVTRAWYVGTGGPDNKVTYASAG